jgi:Dolichyl-phosphate-mannose-protein mannosyltransferase/SEC-C motif
LIAGLLALAFFFQLIFASARKSPAYDEPAHIAAGLSYWQTRVIAANPQHPPLLKELSALSMMAAGIRMADSPAVRSMEAGERGMYDAGSEVIRDGGPARVLFWARLPFMVLATLAGLLLFVWGRQMLGDTAALAALFLYAVSPTMLAHSFLVTTDAGLAAFALLFFFALWNYLRWPSVPRMVLCGAAMGAMVASKFSGVALVPVGAILLFASLRWPAPRIAGAPRAFWEPRAAIAEPAGGKNALCPCGSGKKYKMCHGRIAQDAARARPSLIRCVAAFAAMCAIAWVVVEACYFFPANWFAYLDGFRAVNADHDPDYRALFAGRLVDHSIFYYALAWLLKETVAGLIAAAIGVAALARTAKVATLAKWFIALPPAVLFVGYSISSDDLGIRYLVPLLPFVYLIGGWGLASLLERRTWLPRAAAAVLCVWMVMEDAGVWPDQLSYFNELACLPSHAGEIGFDGGSRCGTLWLDDHNVDWGQGLLQLRAWAAAHARGRALKLAYFGSISPDVYGFNDPPVSIDELMTKTPEPGLYAVSAHLVARLPVMGEEMGDGAWMRTMKPSAIVGHAFYIYDIPSPR